MRRAANDNRRTAPIAWEVVGLAIFTACFWGLIVKGIIG